MASHINFTETAAKAQEQRRLAYTLENLPRPRVSIWARFWHWMNTPLWGKKNA